MGKNTAYALVAYLDYETELWLKNLWINLSIENITYYGIDNGGKRPHITLASYENIDSAEFIQLLDKHYNDKNSVPLSLNKLGTFLETSTIFFEPTVTNELLNFHNSHHEYFSKYNNDENSLYLPDVWNPHCTIASRLSDEKIVEAFKYVRENIKKLATSLCEIGLIEVQLDDNDMVTSEKQVFSKKLK